MTAPVTQIRERSQITLECTEQRGTDVKGMSRYTTEKVGFKKLCDPLSVCCKSLSLGTAQSRRNDPDRMELMKYNPFLQRHTLHREIKSKK